MRLLASLLFAVLVLGPGGTVVAAADGEKGGPAKPSEDQWLKLPFPEVEGWKRLPAKALPGDGYAVGYNAADGTAVTFYVYNRGMARIPDDPSAGPVQREMAEAKDAVRQMKEMGRYDEVTEEASGESTLGGAKDGRKVLHARYRLTFRSTELLSDIYVLPYRNHFLKVRTTRPAAGAEKSAEALAGLYAAVDKMLARE
jgi:hypothetical protein